MDHAAFYKAVRSRPFGGSLSQRAVDGMSALFTAFSEYGDGDRRKLAYILGTAFHESDRFKTMEEYASGAAYEGRSDLGNTQTGDGKRYKGRGLVQVTGRRNYTDWAKRLKVDLVGNPELAETTSIAARICVEGMMLGTFTGKKLPDYIGNGKVDYESARRTVNGTDRADLIAGYANVFDKALVLAHYDKPSSAPMALSEPVEAVQTAKAGLPATIAGVSKAIGAAQGAAKGAAVGPAIALLAPKLGLFPEWIFEPAYQAAILLVGGVIVASVWAFVSTYRAPPNEA